MTASGNRLLHPRLVVGLLIMVVGTLFLLDNLDLLDVRWAARLWPLLFVAVGLTMVLQPAGTTNRGVGAFLVVAGVWILLYDFDIIGWSFWDAWPAFLIALGAWMIWRGFGAEPEAGRSTATTRPRSRTTDADTISAFAFMSSIDRVSTAKSFRGGELTAIMGGCEIDLRQAALGDEAPVIDTFAFWGGIDIRVPQDWVVENKVMPLLGGLHDETEPADETSPNRLLVRGSAIMGGVKVSN